MPLAGAGCKGCWGEPIEARVWAFSVVVDPPCFDDPACRGKAAEQVFVQAFIPESPVEAFHKPVLLGLPSAAIPSAAPLEPWAAPPGAM